MTSSDIKLASANDEPVRLPKRKRPPLVDMALPAVALSSGAMLFLAVPSIIEADDFWSYAKAALLASSATVVAYGVNKLAIERGAPLATRGYGGATAVSIGSILAVGGGLYAATYSGLVFDDVAELRLQAHGYALSEFVGERSDAAAQASRVTPAIRAIVGDLEQKTACEIAESCISGRRNGGRGPVTRALQDYTGRAAAIGQQIAAGDVARQEIVLGLTAHIAEYQKTLGDSDKGVSERRSDLQKVDAKIGQAVGELNEAVPLALLSAYASELQAGVRLDGHPEAQSRLNGVMGRHGQNLASVIESIGKGDRSPPAFPARTGVADTFAYIGHFLPVAAITAVVELIFPLILWAYTFWALRWEQFKREPNAPSVDDEADGPPAATAPTARVIASSMPAIESPARRAYRRRSEGARVHTNPAE